MTQTADHPRPTDRFKTRDLGDEYLFYDRDTDRVHVLNGTAREIFLLCDGSRSEQEISETFAARYDEELATAKRDALEVLDELIKLGLLEK